MAYYSGSSEDVQRYMKLINIGAGRADEFTSTEVAKYQADADEIIDSILRSVVATPVIQITRSSVQKYPYPIELIAQQLTAGLIIENVLSQTQPDLSPLGTTQKTAALTKLGELVAGIAGGTQRLEGARIKARNRFIRPTTAPLGIPAGTTPVLAPTVVPGV